MILEKFSMFMIISSIFGMMTMHIPLFYNIYASTEALNQTVITPFIGSDNSNNITDSSIIQNNDNIVLDKSLLLSCDDGIVIFENTTAQGELTIGCIITPFNYSSPNNNTVTSSIGDSIDNASTINLNIDPLSTKPPNSLGVINEDTINAEEQSEDDSTGSSSSSNEEDDENNDSEVDNIDENNDENNSEGNNGDEDSQDNTEDNANDNSNNDDVNEEQQDSNGNFDSVGPLRFDGDSMSFDFN